MRMALGPSRAAQGPDTTMTKTTGRTVPRYLISADRAGRLGSWATMGSCSDEPTDTLSHHLVIPSCRVFRLLLLAIMLGLSFQLSGLASALGEAPCRADCPDDQSGGECPPNCHSCDCRSTPRTIACEPSPSVPLPEVGTAGWFAAGDTPPAVDPSEILHIPKRLA